MLCAVACLLAVLTYGEALSDASTFGSYRIVSRYFVRYRVVSYRVPYGCIVPSLVMSHTAVLAGVPQSTLEPMQRVQNAAARLVHQLDVRDHVTPSLMVLLWPDSELQL